MPYPRSCVSHVLHHDLINSNVTIRQLYLSLNYLTRSSSSSISDLTTHCGVEELRISGNYAIGEDTGLLQHAVPSLLQTSCTIHDGYHCLQPSLALHCSSKEKHILQLLNIIDDPITNETWILLLLH